VRIDEVIEEIRSRKNTGELSKKRLACAHCGNSWIEFVGLIVGNKKGLEDLCLRVGVESEGFRLIECQECGSKDVYEITFPEGAASEKLPLNFKGIKRVSKPSRSTSP